MILDRTTFDARCRISVAAIRIDAKRVQAREGVHLLIHSGQIDLADSEFLGRSILAGHTAMDQIAPHQAPLESVVAATAAKKFRDDLADELAELPPGCCVTSLERANIGELALSDVVLDKCVFAGAHGLDKLRIGTDCSFRRTPLCRRWRLFTRRRIIVEEVRWREAHTGRGKSRHNAEASVSAFEIAGIYRSLRKGLEDARNEPGAADFYYGEMEMRRLAGREHSAAAGSKENPSRVERALLYGYWAVSGYGLRASRALITLAVVVVGAALLYTLPVFATTTPPPVQIAMIDPNSGAVTYRSPPAPTAPGFWTALEYSARESISLLQVRSMPTIDTTGAGTILDFILRLAGPVLLAFAVLALRARTKR